MSIHSMLLSKKSNNSIDNISRETNCINNRTNKRTSNILVVDRSVGCLACKQKQNIKEGCCWYISKYSEFLKAIGTMLLIIRKYVTAWNYKYHKHIYGPFADCSVHHKQKFQKFKFCLSRAQMLIHTQMFCRRQNFCFTLSAIH